MKPELSILVPVYNADQTIATCLESLLSCTIPLEIIVCDDGSTDQSSLIIREYSEKYPHIHLIQQENQGIAATRNRLLKEVNTEYFGFLDSDDTVRPTIYQQLLTKMKEEKSDIAFSDFLWVYDQGKTRRAIDTLYSSQKELITKMFATLWNKIYRSSWFFSQEISFPDDYRYEDASLLYRLALHMKKVSYVPEISVDYYQRQGSITHSYDLHIEDMLEVFRGIHDYYLKEGQDFQEELEYLFVRFFLGNSYLRACRISDRKLRYETLRKSYDLLITYYPNYRKKRYLQEKGKKNLYYRMMNRHLYFFLPAVFRFLYRTGVMAS